MRNLVMRLPVNLRHFRAPGFSRRRLPLVAANNLRIAQIGAKPSFDAVKAFPSGAWSELEAYRPRAIVGNAPDLQELARRTQQRSLELSCLDHALFVLTNCGEQTLSDIARVVFWQAFGVPVYELLIGPQADILASECEAHDGWHVEPGTAFSLTGQEVILGASGRSCVPTGIAGPFETGRCACGREGMRLLNIGFSASPAVRRLAAIA